MASDMKSEFGTDEPRSAASQLHCSFCGKCQDQVRKLIAGPTVQICDECVDLCNEIIERDVEADSGPPTVALDAIAGYALCRLPKDVKELRMIAERGIFWVECIDTVRSSVESERGNEAT